MATTRKIMMATLLAVGVNGLFIGQAMAETTIRIGYVKSWPASNLVTRIAGRIIENRLSVNVALKAVNPAYLYQGVASGTLDAQLSAWLPATHHAYYSHLWEQMINLGPNLLGAKLGIAVPEYADIDSIKDLQTHAAAYDYKIIGVGLGAGVNINTKKAIAAYNLSMHLVPSSTASMAAALRQATSNHELIAVTAWKPLWIWSEFDLKFLEDPKHVYGTGDHINTIVSTGLWDKAPRVFKFLDRFMIPISAINRMENKLRNNHTVEEVVSAYIQSHGKKIKMWLHGLQPQN